MPSNLQKACNELTILCTSAFPTDLTRYHPCYTDHFIFLGRLVEQFYGRPFLAGAAMQASQFQSVKASIGSPPNTRSAAPLYLLWICLIAWAISFFLPTARTQNWDQEKTMFGWEAAWTALLLFILPVKGAWFGFFPHVLSVFANFFMLWSPFQVKRLKEARGRNFALAFTFAAAIPVTLLFLPSTIGWIGIVAFKIGFVLWTLAILGASAWFCWMGWRSGLALLPSAALIAALLCGLYVWSPFREDQQQLARRQLEEKSEQYQRSKRYEDEEIAAMNAIAQNGLLAFNEPMSQSQVAELASELWSTDPYSPQELLAASEHYQNPTVVYELARRRDCPPEALEILLQHATEKEKMTASQEVSPQQLYITIAKNPNASPTLLLRMLRSESAAERAAALGGSKLPVKEKIGYLQKGCSLSDKTEIQAVGENTDTPVEVMECLANNPWAAAGLAANPNTPTSLLDQMSRSSDPWIAKDAKFALTQRQSN